MWVSGAADIFLMVPCHSWVYRQKDKANSAFKLMLKLNKMIVRLQNPSIFSGRDLKQSGLLPIPTQGSFQ